MLASSPEMIAQAMGGQSVDEENASGSRPVTVVAVVSRIGRVWRRTASSTASLTVAPSFMLWSMRSTSTIALFTTLPTSAKFT